MTDEARKTRPARRPRPTVTPPWPVGPPELPDLEMRVRRLELLLCNGEYPQWVIDQANLELGRTAET